MTITRNATWFVEEKLCISHVFKSFLEYPALPDPRMHPISGSRPRLCPLERPLKSIHHRMQSHATVQRISATFQADLFAIKYWEPRSCLKSPWEQGNPDSS
jgi:hypothetical protein